MVGAGGGAGRCPSCVRCRSVLRGPRVQHRPPGGSQCPQHGRPIGFLVHPLGLPGQPGHWTSPVPPVPLLGVEGPGLGAPCGGPRAARSREPLRLRGEMSPRLCNKPSRSFRCGPRLAFLFLNSCDANTAFPRRNLRLFATKSAAHPRRVQTPGLWRASAARPASTVSARRAGGWQPRGSRLSRVHERPVPAGPAGSLGLGLRSSGPGLPEPHVSGASRSSGSPQMLTAPRQPGAPPSAGPPAFGPQPRPQLLHSGSLPPPLSTAVLTRLVAFSETCSACPGLGICGLLAWAGAGSPW